MATKTKGPYTIERLTDYPTYPRNGSAGSIRHTLWVVRDASGKIVDSGSKYRELVRHWDATKPKAKKIKMSAEGRVTIYGATPYGCGPWEDGVKVSKNAKLVIVGNGDLERNFLHALSPEFTGSKVRITIEEI